MKDKTRIIIEEVFENSEIEERKKRLEDILINIIKNSSNGV